MYTHTNKLMRHFSEQWNLSGSNHQILPQIGCLTGIHFSHPPPPTNPPLCLSLPFLLLSVCRCARTQSCPPTPVSKRRCKHRSSLFPVPPLPTPQHPEDIQDHFKAGGKEKRKIQREAEPILKDCWTSSDPPEPAFRRRHETVTTSRYRDVLVQMKQTSSTLVFHFF